MASLEITDQIAAHFTPEWRASRELIAALLGLLAGRRPMKVLEFGPGLTTVLLFQYLKIRPASLVVVDEPGPFHEKLLAVLTGQPVPSGSVQVITSKTEGDCFYPIEPGSPHEKTISDRAPYDLILIDGPASSVARNAPEARQILTAVSDDETTFVIDDSNRRSEAQLVEYLVSRSPHRRTAMLRDSQFTHRTSTLIFPGQ